MSAPFDTETAIRAVRAEGFAEGIEAAANWHQAEATRLVAVAVGDLRHGRFEQGTEVLNRACEHALCVPAIRSLAPLLEPGR